MSYSSRNNLLSDGFNKIAGNRERISVNFMRAYLKSKGFLSDDPRWCDVYAFLNKIEEVNHDNFDKIFGNNISDLNRCVNENFIIEDFTLFNNTIKEIFENQLANLKGEVNKYIPQLARQNPDKFGLSFCSIDGQRINLGDYDDPFSIQSISSVINYGIAVEGEGLENVHKFVGKEPSGSGFGSVVLTTEHKPYNPMENIGAIMTCSLIERELCSSAEKFDKVLGWWKRLAGGLKPGYDIATYLSEKQVGDNNRCLSFFLQSENLYPENTDIEQNLDLYFQMNSIEMSCKKLAIVAATLANGGVCPITKERVFQNSTTNYILSLMYSCGLNDYSGQFSFKIGLPAKSCISGAIMVVVPNVGGFCTFAPRLDTFGRKLSRGISARGISFYEELVQRFTFHNFDIFSNIITVNSIECDENGCLINFSREKDRDDKEGNKQIDPLRKIKISQDEVISSLFYAASENDLNHLSHLILKNVNLNLRDHNKRTALHVAASEGNYEAVKLLIKYGANPSLKDRFNNTPIDDALRGDHEKVYEYLKELGNKMIAKD